MGACSSISREEKQLYRQEMRYFRQAVRNEYHGNHTQSLVHWQSGVIAHNARLQLAINRTANAVAARRSKGLATDQLEQTIHVMSCQFLSIGALGTHAQSPTPTSLLYQQQTQQSPPPLYPNPSAPMTAEQHYMQY